MRDLEKTLDLDSFGQVRFESSQRLGISASIAETSQQHSQDTNTLVTGTSRGKGPEINIQATKKSIMSKKLETYKE